MQGTVLAVEVADGDEVEAGQVLCIVEAMKMENEVHAHRAGRVADLSVAPGQPVKTGQIDLHRDRRLRIGANLVQTGRRLAATVDLEGGG